mmetsp:Transcript_49240/g.145378  ORF Transcript_49240/g.145378 Transcript_49240/m.145378 type:complete len:171 (-) Transcript_49240:90-602(-)
MSVILACGRLRAALPCAGALLRGGLYRAGTFRRLGNRPGQQRLNAAQRCQARRLSVFPESDFPVNTVCRISRFKVFDAAAALKADNMLKKWNLEVMETVPGFMGLERRVCPEDWEYETSIKFESKEAMECFMDSDAFQMETLPRLAALLTECAVGGVRGVARRSFIYDDF